MHGVDPILIHRTPASFHMPNQIHGYITLNGELFQLTTDYFMEMI